MAPKRNGVKPADASQCLHRLTFFRGGKPAEGAAQDRHPARPFKADIGQQRKAGNQVELLEDDPDASARGAAANGRGEKGHGSASR